MTQPEWWQTAAFYQIYPRSFADHNGDGIGDLRGIVGRLDYLKDLGVDAIWLSPHYPSPQFDCGYDVADYTAVAPEYGSLQDFKDFLHEVHWREMRLIIDLVLNHTSDRHPWFLDSCSGRENPYRDWYVWRDGLDGGPPNNWNSLFGGSAWELDPHTGQYYYHFFFKQQPDLNWRNPAVRRAVFDAARFWLDLGVDGFRLDAIGTLFEDPAGRDQPVGISPVHLRQAIRTAQDEEEKTGLITLWKSMFQFQVDRPENHSVLKELRAVVDEYEGRVLVGESEDIAYHGSGEDELHMVFNFPLMNLKRLEPEAIRRNQEQRLGDLAAVSPHAWPCNTLGNHDVSRLYGRYTQGEHDEEIARLALALVLTLRGTPFLYYGEEIGMTNLLLEDLAQFKDMLGVWMCRAQVEELGLPEQEALANAARYTRDRARTPMQWSSAPNAGFSPPGVETWLPVHPNHAQGVNVAGQQADPGSLLNYYRRLLHLRRQTPALLTGSYTALPEAACDCLAFLRQAGGQTCLVALNFAAAPAPLSYASQAADGSQARVLYASTPRPPREDLRSLILAPFEVFIAEILPEGAA